MLNPATQGTGKQKAAHLVHSKCRSFSVHITAAHLAFQVLFIFISHNSSTPGTFQVLFIFIPHDSSTPDTIHITAITAPHLVHFKCRCSRLAVLSKGPPLPSVRQATYTAHDLRCEQKGVENRLLGQLPSARPATYAAHVLRCEQKGLKTDAWVSSPLYLHCSRPALLAVKDENRLWERLPSARQATYAAHVLR